jgi:hypothetical protein
MCTVRRWGTPKRMETIMRQAITTKYIGPTNNHGARIKAQASAGSVTNAGFHVNWAGVMRAAFERNEKAPKGRDYWRQQHARALGFARILRPRLPA